jgi:peptidyl-prolyl cis-trans isomerase A (cyclophilin A)
MKTKKISLFILTSLSIVALIACGAKSEKDKVTNETLDNKSIQIIEEVKTVSETPINKEEGLFAEIVTSKGSIFIELAFEKVPMTVANFVGLAEGVIENNSKEIGTPYYDGIIFHRVIPNFMIQGGDPTGTGMGGPGYKFRDEIDPSLRHDRAGVLSMANAGPSTNGSQFFITHNETPWLDGKHTVFGYVTKGQNIVDAIQQGVVIETIKITRKGKEAKAFDAAKIFAEMR